MRALGVDDALILVGLLLVGLALWLAFGAAATIAYGGMVCLLVGLACAWRGKTPAAK